MDETTIVPPNSQHIITKSHDHHQRELSLGDAALHLSARIDDDTRQIMQQVNADAMLIMDSEHRSADATRATSERQNIDTRSAVNVNAADIRRTVEAQGISNKESTERNGLETRSDVDRNAMETRGLVKNFGELNKTAIDRNLEKIGDYGYRALESQCKTDSLIAEDRKSVV